MVQRWKRLLQNLTLSFGSFVVCVAAFELVLRLNGYGNLEIYHADPALYWKLKPNQNCYTKVDHKPVHINSHGTRGPEFQVPKPPNTVRIVSLGDSRTFGWGLTEAETYSHRLQENLQSKLGAAKRVEVINAGVNGWSFPQTLVYFRDTALGYQPDIVILGNANPWTEFSEKSSPAFVKKMMFRVRLKNFMRRFALYHFIVEVKLRKVYEHYRLKFIPISPEHDPLFKEQQQKDPYQVMRSAMEDLCTVARSKGVRPVLLYLPELGQTNTAPLLKAKRELSQSLQIPLVEVSFPGESDLKSLYLEADTVHFNARGNEIIAAQLAETVNRLTDHE